MSSLKERCPPQLLPNQNCLPCGSHWGAIQESPLSYPPKGECLSSSHIAWRIYVLPFPLTKKLRFHFMNEPLTDVFIFLQVQVKSEWGFNVLQQRLDEVFWAVKINEASNHLTGTIVECLRSVAKCNSTTLMIGPIQHLQFHTEPGGISVDWPSQRIPAAQRRQCFKENHIQYIKTKKHSSNIHHWLVHIINIAALNFLGNYMFKVHALS